MANLNALLLVRTMEHIEAHPDSWDQATLGVTTGDGRVVADFPGWAVMLHEPGLRPPQGYRDADGTWVPEASWIVHGLWAPAYATKLLGLKVCQRQVFFFARWPMCALRRGVDALIASAGEISDSRLRARMRGE